MTPARAHSLSLTHDHSLSLSLPLWDQSVRFMSLYFDSRAFKCAFPVRGLSVRDTIDALRRSRTEPISVSRQMVHDFKFQVPVYIKIASLGNSNSSNNKRNQSPIHSLRSSVYSLSGSCGSRSPTHGHGHGHGHGNALQPYTICHRADRRRALRSAIRMR